MTERDSNRFHRRRKRIQRPPHGTMPGDREGRVVQEPIGAPPALESGDLDTANTILEAVLERAKQ